MCGIAGQIALNHQPIRAIEKNLHVMSSLIEHRGPDGEGYWTNKNKSVGLSHRRLSIIDLSDNASQPMVAKNGNVITYNGEIFNFLELKHQLQNKVYLYQLHRVRRSGYALVIQFLCYQLLI